MSDFYDDKTNSESNFTMSSGLSPRDTKPREREFDIEAAKKVRLGRGGMWCVCECARVYVCMSVCGILILRLPKKCAGGGGKRGACMILCVCICG